MKRYLIRRHDVCLFLLSLSLSATPARAWFGARRGDGADATPPKQEDVLTEQVRETKTTFDEVIRRIETTLGEARGRLETLKAREADLEEEIATTEAQIRRLEQENTERYFQLEAQQKRLDEIEQSVLAKSDRVERLMDAVQTEKMVREIEEAHHETQRELAQERARAAEQAQQAATKREQLERALERARREASESGAALTMAQGRLVREQQKNVDLQRAHDALQKQLDDAAERLARSEREKQQLMQTLTDSLREFEAFVTSHSGEAP